jgi:hypothetical protein
MGLAGKILTGLFAFFLIIALVGVVFTTTAKATVFSPSFIKAELEDLNLYSKAKDEIKKNVVKGNGNELAEIFDAVVSESWLRERAEEAIDNFFPYLKSEIDTFELEVGLIELKEDLKAKMRLENLPYEIFEWVDNFIPDEVKVRITPEQISLIGFPENFKLKEDQERKVLNELNMVRGAVDYFYLASTLILALAVVFTLAIIAISRRVKSICRTLGISAILGGALSFILAVFAMNLASDALATTELPEFLTSEAILDIVRDILAPAKTLAIALGVAGGALVALSILYPKRIAPAQAERLKRR